jgi:hypothetical protein
MVRKKFPLRAGLATALSFVSCIAFSQSIENVSAKFADGKVSITYDLKGKETQEYEIRVYSSHNQFSVTLRNVSGEVGRKIKSGTGKLIEWDANELVNYNGELTFKLRGEVMAGGLRFSNPVVGSSFRRGKTASIKWEGGKQNDNAQIELLKGGQKISSAPAFKNLGSYDYPFPADLQKGNDYTLRLLTSGQTIVSPVFAVKSKIPLLLKLSPIVVVAAVVGFLGGGGGDTPSTPAAADLAVAPKGPDGN